MASCYYAPWLLNIPKGQIMRLNRNCTEESDYKEQASMIGQRFIQKGYKESFIRQQIEDVDIMNRADLIKERIDNYQENILIVLSHGAQHKKIEKAFRKHWPVLTLDKHLQQILPTHPKFTYRRAPKLHDKLAQNVLGPPKKSEFIFFAGKSFFSMQTVLYMYENKKAK